MTDLDKGTGKCNCTMCWKQRMWNAGQLTLTDFRLLRMRCGSEL